MKLLRYFTEPVPPRHRKWWALLALLAILVWGVIAYLHLHFFSTPTLDGWCYFAPAAFATYPFALASPLLGGFEGLDAAWGMHWPGAVGLHTLAMAALPASSALHIAYLLGLWAALALVTGGLAYRLCGNGWAGWLVALLVLTDKAPFNIAFEMRPEIITSLLMMLALALAMHMALLRTPGKVLFYVLCFLLPTLHPMGVIFSGALGLVLGTMALRGEWPWPRYLLMAASMAAGALAVACYFAFQPAAYAQFLDHATFNSVPFSWGGTMVLHLWATYQPLYAGVAIYLLALAGVVWFCLRREPFGEARPPAGEWIVPVAALFFISLLVAQLFHNKDYITTLLPLALMLAASMTVVILRALPSTALRLGGVAVILALIALNGAFWPSRTMNYVKHGLPDLRSEINAFYRQLPDSPRMGIPVKVWQAASMYPRPGVMMTTLPHHATPLRREAYERYVGGQLQAGDLLIIDQKYGLQPTYYLSQGLMLEPVAWLDRRLKFGRNTGGFDLVVYRLVERTQATPEAIAPPAPGKRRAPDSIQEVYD